MKLNRRFAALLLCGVMLCSCAPEPADNGQPEEPTPQVKTLRFQVNSRLPPEMISQVDAFADRVARLSGGALQIEVTTGLPDYSTVKNGETDFALLRNGQMVYADNLFSMFSLPFLYDDYTHMSVALNSEEVRKVLEERLAGQNILPLLAVYSGSRYLVTDKRELRKPTDFKALVIAMRNDNDDKLEIFQALGARVLPYTLSSMAPLLETKVEILPEDLRLPSDIVTVDTVELSLEQVLQLLPDPHTLYLAKTYHTLAPLWVVASKDAVSRLDRHERAILDEGLAGLISEMERQQTADEQELFEQIEQEGITVVEVERSLVASVLYGSKGTGTDRYKPPAYFDSRVYKLIQSYS